MADRYKKWLHLPEKYQLVVDDTFELFYRGILLATDPYVYNIDVRCPKGAAYRRKFVYTPSEEDVGEYKLRIELSDDKGTVLDNAEVKLIVSPKAKSPKEETYVLCIGDSLTSGGIWPSECYRRLTGGEDTENNGPCGNGLTNIRFIGGREGKYGAWYEGYGGWRHESYNTAHMATNSFKYIYADHGKTDVDRHSVYTDGVSHWKLEEIEDGRIKLLATSFRGPLEPTGVLKHAYGGENHGDIVYTRVEAAPGNPFWNTERECVDYKAYCEKLGVPRIDIAVVLLGWNSWSRPEGPIKEQTRLFIDNLRCDFPECKIVMTGLQITSSQDGLGTNYGCMWSFYEKMEFVFNIEKWYKDVAAEYDEIYFVNFSGQFDSENNYPTIERPVNVRSKKTEIIQSNGVHPNPDGYRQIADLVYRQLNSMLLERE